MAKDIVRTACLLGGALVAIVGALAPSFSHAASPPFDIPTSGYVGYFVFDKDTHPGVDIWTNEALKGVPPGNNVYLPYAGKFVQYFTDNRPGRARQGVVFSHEVPGFGTVYTRYFHMANEYTASSYVVSGFSVVPKYDQGTYLGRQGNRRWVGGPETPSNSIVVHLHFEVSSSIGPGGGIDPTDYLGMDVSGSDRVPLWFPVTATAESVPVVVQGPIEDVVSFRPNYGVPTYVSPSSKAPGFWELIIQVVRKSFEWLTPVWTKIRLSIPVLFQSPVYVTWDQYDRAHALQMAFLIRGTDGADRLLIYSANASNHWYRAGWVDMGSRDPTYHQWETFSRDLGADYQGEYGIQPYLVKEIWVGHFIYGGFEGDQGGIIQNIYLQGCSIPAGAGSSRQLLFQQAYHRVGGVRPFRCPAENANWWGGLVRQEFQGGPGVGVSALLHDQLADNADPLGVPAYMVQGGFWTGFYKIRGPFLGAPASDHYINAFGKPQTDFRNGFAWWTGVANWRKPLVKGSAASVYFIERGTKRGIPNPETLFALGYGWGDVQTVTDTELNQYPTGSLIPDVNTTWLTQFYDNRLWLRPAKVTRAEGDLNFNWGLGSPHALIPKDSFSAVFSRYLDLTGGEYEFFYSVDDGIWVYLDGSLLFFRGLGSGTVTVILPAGRHLLQVKYREYTAPAYLSLSFEATDTLPPVADIGGPYLSKEGETLTFDASSSFDPEPGTGIAKIEWDLDGDGSFDDFIGPTLSRTYGDDIEFGISIKVTDGAGNFSTGTTTVTIENVAPTIVLDKSNATSFVGGSAFVATIDDLLSFPLRVTDPGSDDLTIFTNFGDGNAQADVFFNDPNVGFDPFPSPDIHPRNISLAKLHQYLLPNIFELTVTATDDDGGVSEDSLLVLITENKVEIRTQGFWKNQYGQNLGEGVQYPGDFLFGFWEVGKFISEVFEEITSASTLPEIEDMLTRDGEGNPMIDRAKSQCLATLLNFSSGSIKWDSQVDTDNDGTADTTFSQAIVQAEDLIADPTSTDLELEQAKDICDSINNMGELASGGFNFAYLFALSVPVLLVLGRIIFRFVI